MNNIWSFLLLLAVFLPQITVGQAEPYPFIMLKRKSVGSTPDNGYAELATKGKNCGGASCQLNWLKELNDETDFELRYWWNINGTKTDVKSMTLCEALTAPTNTVQGVIARVFSTAFFNYAKECAVKKEEIYIANKVSLPAKTDDALPCGPGHITTVVLLSKPEDEGFKESEEVKVISAWWGYTTTSNVECVDVGDY